MSGEIDIARISRLSASGKRSKIGRLRLIIIEIEKVISAGVSLDRIVAELNEQGMELTLATFKMMLYRLRKEGKGPVVSGAVGNDISTSVNSNPVMIGDLIVPMSLTKNDVDSHVVNDFVPAIPKFQPGEPVRFNWDEYRNAKDLW